MAFTFFFRDYETLELVPEIAAKVIRKNISVKLWDAGCATGAETYSVAIMLKEFLGCDNFENVEITATDIDVSNLFGEKIAKGYYLKNQVISVPKDIIQKYFAFDNESGIYTVDANIREKIRFIKHDLMSLQPVRTDFDIILCKHVLEHFSLEQQIEVLKMFHASLFDDGWLFLDSSQEMPETMDSFFIKRTKDKKVFQKI